MMKKFNGCWIIMNHVEKIWNHIFVFSSSYLKVLSHKFISTIFMYIVRRQKNVFHVKALFSSLFSTILAITYNYCNKKI